MLRRPDHHWTREAEARRGAITVEFAIVAPLVFLVVFASVEFARVNMLLNSMENAAYEGARRAIIPGATVAHARAEAQEVLDAVGAVKPTIEVSPSPLASSTPDVTVKIKVSLGDNAWVLPGFTGALQIERSCTLSREQTSL